MEFNNSDISDIDSPEPLLNSNEGNNNEVNESQQQAQRHYQQKKRKPKLKGWKDKENKNRNILEYVVETVETDVTKQANTKNNQNKNVYEHENDDEEYEDNNQGKDFGVSVVWDFFKKIDKNSAQCTAKDCLKILSTPTSTTSTLKRHLKMHPEENKKMLELEEEKKKLKLKRQASNKNNVLIQSSLPNIFQKNTSYLKTSSKKMKLDEAVGKMIALDFQPYSIVEDRGFRELTYELDPRYTLPSRSKVARNIVPNLYEKVKTSIKEMIDKDKLNVESLCFMTDLWTSRAGHHYIAFNCQYINSDFFLISKTLGCYNFPGPHTAKAISDKLEDMLSEWKIDIEIPLYTVTDNAANMIAALSFLDNFNHLLCADHTLQLCIRHARIGLELDRILEKLQRIATRYHRSSKARMRLEYYQRLYKLPLHEMITMVKTRWNTEYLLLNRSVEQEKAIVAERYEAGKDNLTHTEWNLVKNVTIILKPIADVTAPLGSSNLPTASMLLPVIYSIETELNKFIDAKTQDSADTSIIFARNLLKEVQNRFRAYKNDDVYILAMAVDPRYRLAILTDPAEVESATKKLKKEVHKAYHKSVKTNTSTQIASDPKLNQPQVSGCQQSMITESTETTSVCQSSSNSVWDAVRERCTIYNLRCDFMDMQEILDIEVDNFLHTKNIDVFNDPTKWWRENISTFRHVGIIARHYLGLAATEVSSERLFSHAGAIVTNRRKNLTTEHVEQLVFLHDNL